nr:subfamily T1A non peptidase ue [Hymenolepis microstoma]
MSEDRSVSASLKNILSDPNSNGNVNNLLDVVAALLWDCNFQSAKNSKAIQSFVQRFSELANVIYSQRTKYVDFEMVKVIGQGGFGRVQLVRHKDTRRVYAMKMMSKQHLLDHSQSGYWEERDIMVKAKSEWLVTCHQAFVVGPHVSKFFSAGIIFIFTCFLMVMFSNIQFPP